MDDSLEKVLARYNPGGNSNISQDDIRRNVRQHSIKAGFKTSDVQRPDTHLFFVYFERGEHSLLIPVSYSKNLFVPLSPSSYGFEDDQVSISPAKIDLPMSELGRAAYERLVSQRQVSLSYLLECVGGMVNGSLQYDFQKMIGMDIAGGRDPSGWIAKRDEYSPTGFEVAKGICTDAGASIRSLLSSFGMAQNIKFTNVPVNYMLPGSKRIGVHDTTAVFDASSGRWAVINSKSPTKLYNLVPKDRLVDLDSPYVSRVPK